MSQVNINRVVLTGNLTADPELRNLPEVCLTQSHRSRS